MSNNSASSFPIGIFDSGVGGLSVWRELVKLLPNEAILYVADSANCPYGNKNQDEIIILSDRIVSFLIEQGCKLIVLACNTATAGAIDYLRGKYEVPFVGMEPAVKPAALNSKTGVVGILATAGTFKGRLFNETKERFASDVKVIEQVGEGLVDAVEHGMVDSSETTQLLKSYLQPMLDANVDHLALGCTHYPFLIPQIEKITQNRIIIMDPAPAVAKHTKHLLEENKLDNKNKEKVPFYIFYSTADTATLKRMLTELNIKNYEVQELDI
ncbi:MAG: glutamate racemase [Prevotellaceae bacterium]|nr:glutamate racemase [Prevotellaceae bacterium]